jgi:hypothetical protein
MVGSLILAVVGWLPCSELSLLAVGHPRLAEPKAPPASTPQPVPAERESQTTRYPGKKYFPLGIGKRWVYDVEVDIFLVGTQKGSSTTTIDGTRTVGGKKYYKAVVQPSGFPSNPTDVHYYRRYKDTFYRVFGAERDLGQMVFLRVPFRVGEEWTAKTSDGRLAYKVQAKETVTCWNGKRYRDCFRVLMRGEVGSLSFDDTLWLAPGIGLVKREGRRTLLTYKISLREYR